MFIDNFDSFYVNPLPSSQKVAGQTSKAAQVAKDFEAMFTSMMFKSMRNSISAGKDSLIPKNMGEDVFTEMLDGEYAKMNSERGTLGLAALIQREIERSEGTNSFAGSSAARRASLPLHSGADSATLIGKVRGKWESLISEISGRFGVDKNLVTAVIARESAGNPHAISSKGAKGLMQLMDGTARDMGVSYSFSPADNISGGVKYLKNMLDMFGGNEELALASYNAGPSAVKKFGGIPPYKETLEYVKAVLKLREKAADLAAQITDNVGSAQDAATPTTVNAEAI